MELRLLAYFAAVAEELHVGRAARRLHMTQPPLSRAIRGLEAELGVRLFDRTPTGVALTPAGRALHEEARDLLARADRIRDRVAAAAGAPAITIGTVADSAAHIGAGLVAAFRERHPGVRITIRETDFTDPAGGLRTGAADVAVTRLPFDTKGITVRVLRRDSVGVVVRTDDPLAARTSVALGELADRRWFRLPEGTDPAWRAYWNASPIGGPQRDGPVVRTVGECMQAVLWNATIGVAPLGHAVPDGLALVPLADMAPSPLVVAWRTAGEGGLAASFAELAAAWL